MIDWHALSIDQTKDALKQLPKSSATNVLVEGPITHWYVLLGRQFTNLLVFVLILATIISYFVGDVIDALAILAIILFNGLLGFIQEWKAESAISSLKKMLSPQCRVKREEHVIRVPAASLQVGDYVLLEAGEIVPADIRLFETINLMTNEASLTGESGPVAKTTLPLDANTVVTERTNMAYMGTDVVNGHGGGLVVAIGMETEFGHIAKLTGGTSEGETRLKKELSVLGLQFGLLAIIISALVAILGIVGGQDTLKMFMTGISLAVSAIPEGLPAVVTIALAIGGRAMARRNAMLRQLQAAETLGAITVICTDKTGTLTKNEMTVKNIWTVSGLFEVSGSGYEPIGYFSQNGHRINPNEYAELAALFDVGRKCNTSEIVQKEGQWIAKGSPDEAALLVLAEKAGFSQNHGDTVIKEFSFDSERKRMSVIEDRGNDCVVHVKGAPEEILSRCTHYQTGKQRKSLSITQRNIIESAYHDFANQGLRTLALAVKVLPRHRDITEEDAERDLTFLGVVGVLDSPRDSVKQALKKAKQAGIKIILITGDSPITANAIAKQIGLTVDTIVTSVEMQSMSDDVLKELLQRNIMFARTVPQDKLRIIGLMKSDTCLVAMTGDGVNDAPALKKADVGIAMGIRGTEVAKSVADIVLSDDNFATIIAAVEEGRRQYANIQKFVHYLASANIGEVMAILINMIFGGPLILIPIQILWINLVTDSATAVSLSIERAEKNIMKIPPRKLKAPICDKKAFLRLAFVGSYIGVAAFILYQFFLKQSYELANTIAFTSVVVMSNIHAFNFRNLHGPIADIGWFSNPWLFLAIIAMMSLQLVALYFPPLQLVLHTIPLSLSNWTVILASALPLFIIPETYKWIRSRFL